CSGGISLRNSRVTDSRSAFDPVFHVFSSSASRRRYHRHRCGTLCRGSERWVVPPSSASRNAQPAAISSDAVGADVDAVTLTVGSAAGSAVVAAAPGSVVGAPAWPVVLDAIPSGLAPEG